MLKQVTIAFAVLFSASYSAACHAQVTIPDAAFALKLNELVPAAMTGNVLDEMHPDVLALNSMTVYSLGIADLTGIEFFTGLDTLKCFYNSMDTIPALPPALVYLDCSNNTLTALPPLPATLRYLSCSRNQILEIPALPAGLEYLDVGRNDIVELPTLPAALKVLYVYFTDVTTLPNLPPNLEVLVCAQNYSMQQLPALPVTLQRLECYDNRLYELPALPATLTFLRCNSNFFLTALPPLPDGLRYLECNSNPITQLPPLPSALERLDVPYCDLTSLPALPANLDTLDCRGNELTQLPPLPLGMVELSVAQNALLTSLPELPSTLTVLQAWLCPVLTCLPELPNGLTQLSLQESGVECLPNIPPGLSLYPNALGIPAILCHPAISHCPIRRPLATGTVFRDDNGDGMKDPGEQPLPALGVIGEPGAHIASGDSTGFYVLPLAVGSFQVSGLPRPYHTLTTPAVTVTFTTEGQVDEENDIGYQPIPGIYDLVSDLSGTNGRLGFENNLYLQVTNVGTETTDVSVTLVFDALQTWVSATVVPEVLIDNTVGWTIPALEPGARWNAVVTLLTPVQTALGAALTHVLTALPSEPDVTPMDNVATLLRTVTGSFDPNDKLADPGTLSPEEVNDGRAITYTVRFQNTGNAAAERVLISDTLSTDLQWSTMRLVASSHACLWYLDAGVLYAVFDPINLPDSNANEPFSHGFVKFSMLPRPGLLTGEAISNNADIFFDFNAAVRTNDAIVAVESPTALPEGLLGSFRIYPNPATDRIIVEENIGLAIAEMRMLAVDGRLVRRWNGVVRRLDVGLEGLKPGTYLLHLRTMDGTWHHANFIRE